MTGKIKSLVLFTSFTPLMFKIIGSILLIILSIIAGLGEGAGIIILTALASMNLMFSLYVDYFVFGGIAEKHLGLMTYIRTSFKGEKFIKDVLIADVILRCGLVFSHCIIMPEIGSLIFNGSLLDTNSLLQFFALSLLEGTMLALELLGERKWIKTYSTIVLVSMTSVMINSLISGGLFLVYDKFPGMPAKLGVLGALIVITVLSITLLINVCLGGYRSGNSDV
ncbi:MAG: hypothetical protein J6U37_01435 [Lachnospiraceae bacterium]|nr:hypothetical protein [Lachnospiraceae bacterium]